MANWVPEHTCPEPRRDDRGEQHPRLPDCGARRDGELCLRPDRVDCVTFLPRGVSWVARVIGQVSNRNLMYSEQLGAGGPDSVRGYFTDTALGSQGVLVSQELRAPAFRLAHTLGQTLPIEDQEQLGVFWDYGHVSQVKAIPDQVNEADLSSLGVDLHATFDRYVNLSFDVRWQLRPSPGESKRGVFTDIAVLVGF